MSRKIILPKVSIILSIMLFIQYSIVPFLPSSFQDQLAQAQTNSLKVNFQSDGSQILSGYIPDYGETYGLKNGYTYGWNIDHTDMTVTENTYEDPLSSSIHFHKDGIWEIELVNGEYDVTVSVGDAVYGTTNTINVEGINYWDSLTLSEGEFSQKTQSINVQDGKLTVDHGSLGEGITSINYIEIYQKGDTEVPTVPQNLRSQNVSPNEINLLWDASSDNIGVEGYYVFRDNQKIATVTSSVYYSDTGLTPDTTYIYEVAAFDQQGNISSKSNPLVVSTLSVMGDGIGIKGEYYNGANFDQLQLTRLDPTINFDWGTGSPDPKISTDEFSVRWSGKIQPEFSEDYTFYTETHDGVRLWVNNQLLIDDWNANGMNIQNSGSIPLIAGKKYDIKMEYRETNGNAKAGLYWSSNSQPKEIIPQTQLNPPFIPDKPANLNLSSTSTTVNLSWDEVTGATGYDIEVDGLLIDVGSNKTYTHINLIPDTEHQYRVRSKVPGVTSQWTALKSIFTKIAAPSSVNAVESQGTVTVTWNDVPGATGYEIEVDGVVINNGINTTYIHNGLMPNTEHTYRVRALNQRGAGDWSSKIVIIISSDIPANIQAIPMDTFITITWDPVVDAIGYDIEVDGTVIDNQLNTTYVHSDLQPNTQHSYRVRARKMDKVGEWSSMIVVSTLPQSGSGTGLLGEYFDGDQLTNLITQRVDTNINFDWKNNDPAQGVDESDFSVRWTGQIEPRFSENYTFYTEAHGGVRLWVNNQLLIDDWLDHNMSREQSGIIKLEAGKHYDIQLEYRESNGVAISRLLWESSSQSKEVIPQSQLYPVGIPDNISSSSTETTITLQWNPVSFADGYDVEVDGEVIDNGTNTSFTHTNLLPGTQHVYRVRAKNGVANGEWSSSITEYTKLGIPEIQLLDATETTITVHWESVFGASVYEIEVDGNTIDVGNTTSYEHQGLLSGTLHHYRVRAKTPAVTGEWTDIQAKWTLPDIPQNVQTSATSESITLSWDDVRGATGYDIEVYNTIIDNGNQTSFTENELNPNTQRTYRVRAKNSSGAGKWTPIIAEITLPGVPDNLSAEATDTSITVTWDPSSGATAYDLEVDGVLVENLTNTEYVHSGLEPNSTHTYKVRAKNERGMSNWSETIHPTTLPPVPQIIEVITTSTKVTVTWNEVVGATGYEIEVDGVVKDNGASTTFVHEGLSANTEHTYRVRAKNGDIRSFWSESVTTITMPAVPQNLKTMVTSTEITLTWDLVPGATGYEVEVDGVIVDNGLNTTYVHTDLEPLSTHTYRVRARNEGGAGDWSMLLTETTIFGTPTNLSAVPASDSIILTWDPVEGATGYDVMVDGEVVDNGNSTTYTHIGLEPNTWHVYRVRAKSENVVGEWSEAITTATILATPANLQTEAISTQIKVTWDSVSGASGYEIEVDGVVVDNGANTTYMHTNLMPNTEHAYRVRAYDGDVYSEWSQLVTQITTPDVPSIIDSEATTHSITVFWGDVSGATSYDIEVDGKIIKTINGTSYTHEELEPNTMHTYRVRAVNEGGTSEWSELFEKITTPELNIQVGKDTQFNFVTVAPQKEGSSTRKMIVTYNPDEVEVLDLSATTPEANLEEGSISGTNIKVVSFTPGKIVYEVDGANKTVVNIIRFIAKTSEYTNITYTIE